jgi:hypothetical protein
MLIIIVLLLIIIVIMLKKAPKPGNAPGTYRDTSRTFEEVQADAAKNERILRYALLIVSIGTILMFAIWVIRVINEING